MMSGPPRTSEPDPLDADRLEPLLAAFGLSGPLQIQTPRKGSGRTLKRIVRTAEGVFFLRRFGATDAARLRLGAVHALMQRIGQHATSVPVPMPLADQSGRTIHERDEGLHEIRPFVEGAPARDIGALHDAGVTIVKLHTAMREVDTAGWSSIPAAGYHNQGRVVHRLREAGSSIDLEERYQQAASQAAGVERLPHQLLHGDLHPGNVLARSRRVCAIVDFDETYAAPVELDIAYAMLHFSMPSADDIDALPDHIDLERLGVFMEGCREAGLSLAAPDLVPVLMAEALIAEVSRVVQSQPELTDAWLALADRRSRWLLETGGPSVAALAAGRPA